MMSTGARAIVNKFIPIGRKPQYFSPQILLNGKRVNAVHHAENKSHLISAIYSTRKLHRSSATNASSKIKSRAVKKIEKPKKLSPKSTKAKVAKAAKKMAKKPLIKKKTKKPRKPTKELTDEQKKKLHIKKLRSLVLSPPAPLPRTPQGVFFSEKLSGQASNIRDTFRDAAAKWKALTPAEANQYRATATRNQSEYDTIFKAWLEDFTPDQIRIANNARKLINKLVNKRTWSILKDHRVPKRPGNAFVYYLKEHFSSGQASGVSVPTATKKLAEEYNALAPSIRKKYEDIAQSDRQRYAEQYKAVYNRDPRTSTALRQKVL